MLSTPPRKFGNHLTVHRATEQPSVRTTLKPMFNPTFSSLFGSPGATWYCAHISSFCTSMLWSLDSCQNRASTDQYHLTVSRAQVSTHRDRVFYEVIRWQVTNFQMIAGSSSIFLKKFIWNKLCLCAALLIFWFQTDLGGTSEAKIQPAVTGREVQLLLIFLMTVTRWSRCSSNFYALIGQNLTG